MSLLYKDKKEVTHKVTIRQTESGVNFVFSADCGKHGTDEILDEYSLTPLELLNILQGEPNNTNN